MEPTGALLCELTHENYFQRKNNYPTSKPFTLKKGKTLPLGTDEHYCLSPISVVAFNVKTLYVNVTTLMGGKVIFFTI